MNKPLHDEKVAVVYMTGMDQGSHALYRIMLNQAILDAKLDETISQLSRIEDHSAGRFNDTQTVLSEILSRLPPAVPASPALGACLAKDSDDKVVPGGLHYMDKDTKNPAPPYVAYKTLKNFLERFRQGAPARIGRGLMGSMSGASQSQVTTALRFLGLISEQGIPTDTMKKLVLAQGSEWNKIMQGVLNTSYPGLFRPGFDLGTTTAHLIREEFEKTSASGATLKRCVYFFLAAAKDAGLTLSPYVKEARKPRGSGNGTPRIRRVADTPDSDVETSVDRKDGGSSTGNGGAPQKWGELLLTKFPTFDPAWPDEVKSKWFDAFERLMGQDKKG